MCSGVVTRNILSFRSFLLLHWNWLELLCFGCELGYSHRNHFQGCVYVLLEMTCSWCFCCFPTRYVKLFICQKRVNHWDLSGVMSENWVCGRQSWYVFKEVGRRMALKCHTSWTLIIPGFRGEGTTQVVHKSKKNVHDESNSNTNHTVWSSCGSDRCWTCGEFIVQAPLQAGGGFGLKRAHN